LVHLYSATVAVYAASAALSSQTEPAYTDFGLQPYCPYLVCRFNGFHFRNPCKYVCVHTYLLYKKWAYFFIQ